MKTGIILNNKSFCPEAYAYSDYLNKNGMYGYPCTYKTIEENTDVIIDLMGFRPFKRSNYVYIHDYSSLSTPPYVNIKNYLKKFLNFKPNKRIFNCEHILKGFNFKDNIPYIVRDTGIDKIFFNKINNNRKEYDLIYSGTSAQRYGLIKSLVQLSKNGFKIAIVGKLVQENIEILKNYNIKYLGEYKRDDMPEIYSISEGGFNFTPDIYPYNVQNSTKIKEYCASGLKIISNKYNWVEEFQKENGAKFLWYTDKITPDDFYKYNFFNPDLKHLEWGNLLDNCNFIDFIKQN